MSRLTRAEVFSQSWPIILANAALGLAALVDTVVIGRFASPALAGMSAGAAIYSIIYWGFGFLRMTTAGISAQAEGRQDENAVQSHLFRAVPLGMLIGLIILLLQSFIIGAAFYFYQGGANTETDGALYIRARLWGLPAYLGLIAIMGWFIGLGRAGHALIMQLIFNGLNIILSILFVGGLGWGLWGVGIATAIAEWAGLGAGVLLALKVIQKRGGLRRNLLAASNLFNIAELTQLGAANTNIFIRTAALTFGFTFFSSAAAEQGDLFLSGFHIHLQFITLSAFILDGFANTAEARVGAAYGAGSRARFDRAVRLTSEFAFGFGILCTAAILFLGPFAIDFITEDQAVRDVATTYLPYCAMAPIIGFAAFQLDGIFIGTTKTAEMRNAGIAAVLIYLTVHFALPGDPSKHSIWIAFLSYYAVRALTLLAYYPRVRPA